LPVEALPPMSDAQREAIGVEALRVNERYLVEFIEEYGFCPYAKMGRRLGQVRRYIHFPAEDSVQALVDLSHTIAADPTQVVVQIVFPLAEVEPDVWTQFVADLNEHANYPRDRDDRFGTAALHPNLKYGDQNPFSMLTLFRRAPDPTIQWVRQDAVRALYEGRDGGTKAVDIADIDELLARPPMMPLYDRIAITNADMARRLRLENVENMLANYNKDARDSYQRILLDPKHDKAT